VAAEILVELASLDALVMFDDLLVVVALGTVPSWSRFGVAVTSPCHCADMDVSRCSTRYLASPLLYSPLFFFSSWL
jgi:hypothetical protein